MKAYRCRERSHRRQLNPHRRCICMIDHTGACTMVGGAFWDDCRSIGAVVPQATILIGLGERNHSHRDYGSGAF